MNLANSKIIQSICEKYGIRPKDSLGQNFLICPDVLDRMVQAAELKKDDVVLEVGPGFGTLTRKLAENAKRVVAVELDRKVLEVLRESVRPYKNVEIVEGDILRISNFQFLISKYCIVANLPYNITSRFLQKILTAENKPFSMTLMLQREVAERICAKPGKMSVLSVSVQFYAQPRLLFMVPKKCFWPEPEVDSAVVRFLIGATHHITLPNAISEKDFFRVVKIGFSSRRKQLQNNLANGLRLSNKLAKNKLKELGFDPKIRAQELSVYQWITLARHLAKLFGYKQ